MTPMTRLKEALSSKDAFKKHYLVCGNVPKTSNVGVNVMWFILYAKMYF